MYVFKSMNNACNEKPGLFFRESSMSRNMIPQVTTLEQIKNQIEIISVLKSILHINNETIEKVKILFQFEFQNNNLL
jgi:hypothetical protein